MVVLDFQLVFVAGVDQHVEQVFGLSGDRSIRSSRGKKRRSRRKVTSSTEAQLHATRRVKVYCVVVVSRAPRLGCRQPVVM